MSKKSRPKRHAPRAQRSRVATGDLQGFDDDELSPSQRRELERRVEDLKDRTRYMLVSTLGPGFVLYYNVTEDTYSWNESGHASLFKRRKAAQAIQQLLGDKDRIVQCSVNERGQLIKKSVTLPPQSPSRAKTSKKSPR